MRWAIIIPARLASTRFPRKPLAVIAGKSLILRVWERCSEAVGAGKVHVATDSAEIEAHVRGFGGQAIMTSESCRTGTDRVWEASEVLNLTHAINVQGDEPLISPEHVKAFVSEAERQPDTILNGMCRIETESEFRSSTVPKVVTAPDGRLLYMSRGAIPTDKALSFSRAWKQVCIYVFPHQPLADFARAPAKTPLESVEDIEILRFLELGYRVQMVKVGQGSIAVDVPEDIPKVEAALKNGLR